MVDQKDQERPLKSARNRQCRHERRPALRITAEWQCIVAKAETVVVNGDELVVVIEAAETPAGGFSAHDEFHAQITALVFSEHPLYQSIRTVRSFLKDIDGSSTEVPLDIEGCKRVVQGLLSNQRDSELFNGPIPAPLVRFLRKQCNFRS